MKRYYKSLSSSHIIGYVKTPEKSEYPKLANVPGTVVGKIGIEKFNQLVEKNISIVIPIYITNINPYLYLLYFILPSNCQYFRVNICNISVCLK